MSSKTNVRRRRQIPGTPFGSNGFFGGGLSGFSGVGSFGSFGLGVGSPVVQQQTSCVGPQCGTGVTTSSIRNIRILDTNKQKRSVKNIEEVTEKVEAEVTIDKVEIAPFESRTKRQT